MTSVRLLHLAAIAALALTTAACTTDSAASGEKMVSANLADKVALPIDTAACYEGIALNDLFSVWQTLMSFDSMPSAQTLREAAKDPVAPLLFLSGREDITPSIRSRAFEALSLVPDPRVETAYKRVLVDRQEEKLRHASINGYARAFPDKALSTLGPLLTSDPDPQIRLTAAAALCAFGGDEGAAAVTAHARTEKEDWVREKMTGYVKPSKTNLIP